VGRIRTFADLAVGDAVFLDTHIFGDPESLESLAQPAIIR